MLVNGSQSVLKLGLASVIIVGANLLASGTVDLFTYLIFMVIGSRVYAPVSEVMNNIAALFYLDVRINRMNEMEALPVQNGTTEFTPQGYDIEFRQVDFAYEQGKQILNNLSFIARQGEKRLWLVLQVVARVRRPGWRHVSGISSRERLPSAGRISVGLILKLC